MDYSSDEDEEEVDPKALQLSEEERIEREMDDKNMKVETKAKGDGENIPVSLRFEIYSMLLSISDKWYGWIFQMVGDIVRVRYLCTLSDGQVRTSSSKAVSSLLTSIPPFLYV